jgi:methionyl-tRNA formyltransferase
MGSSDFSVPILLELIKKFKVVGVVTEIDKPAGRHKEIAVPPMKLIAQEQGIPLFQPLSLKKNPKIHEQLKALNPDLVVVAAYGKFLPSETLNLAPNGCINVHPSLLPKYRGASPIQTALLNGDKKIGVSLILMDEGMDSGDIVAQDIFEVEPEEDFSLLAKRLALLSAEMLVKNIPAYLAGQLKLKVQNDDKATYCYQINKTDGRIDWNKSAEEIYNQLRAFARWPGVYTTFNKRKLDIIQAFPQEGEKKDAKVGEVFREENKVLVKCGKGCLRLEEVKLEGKQACNINSFVNGYQQFVGATLL